MNKSFNEYTLCKAMTVRFSKPGVDYNEWISPREQPLDKLHLRMCDDNSLQVFLGNRVMGAITYPYFLKIFKEGRGYEFIEEWKIQHHIALRQLSGAQILRITELLRAYGHSGGKI